MSEHYKSLHPLKYYRDYLTHNVRPDGREFTTFRPIVISAGSIPTADGSALVKVGKTSVICGIKAELCQPKPESADEGFFVPNVELSPLCSPRFRPGPPTEQAQVITQLVADILRNSQCLDLKSLCIFPDKLAWCLYADLICLDFDGALVDACVIALITALKTVTLPSVEYDPALDNKVVNLNVRHPLDIKNLPSSTTFVIFDEKILIDPTIEEEDLCTGQIIIAAKNNELCFVHKAGGTAIKDDEFLQCVEASKRRVHVVQKLINKTLQH